MLSATALGILFVVGAIGSAALAHFLGPTLVGTVAKGTTVAFALLAVAAFVL